MTDTTTLIGRVCYVLEKDELARRNDMHLALMVWRTFYGHLLHDTDTSPKIALLDLLHLPSMTQILSAKRRTEPAKKPELKTPWYSDAP